MSPKTLAALKGLHPPPQTVNPYLSSVQVDTYTSFKSTVKSVVEFGHEVLGMAGACLAQSPVFTENV